MLKVKQTLKGKISDKGKLEGKLSNAVVEVTPPLEDLEVTPTLEDQKFKSEMYGYNEVTVKKVTGEELTVTPSLEEQVNVGIYEKVITKAIESEELAITPSMEEQVNEGIFNKVTVAGDAGLVSENIKSGTTIFGVAGKSQVVDTTDATVAASELLAGETAYANGEKITGTMANNGALNYTPTASSQTIPKGYTSGGMIAAVDIETLDSYETCLNISKMILDEGITTNDYTSYSSLVRLYDAINNSSTGHSSTATSWYDQITKSLNVNIGDISSYKWTANAFDYSTDHNMYIRSTSAFTLNKCTLEIVCKCTPYQRNGAPISFGTSSKAFGIKAYTSSGITMVNGSTTKTVSNVSFTDTCTISFVRDSNACYLYKNGELIATMNSTSTSMSGYLQVNGIDTDTFCRTRMKLHAFRVYNKALSSSEIVYNNAIDKEIYGF